MALTKQQREAIAQYIKDHESTLMHNGKLFEIFEGDLRCQLLEALQKQLSTRAFEQVEHRLAPINILNRTVDKLSKIYAKRPTRKLLNATDADKELFDWYVKKLDFNTAMQESNEFFNLFRSNLIEPFLDDEKSPTLRVVPSDRFLPYSESNVNPLKPTHIIKCMGTMSVKRAGDRESRMIKIYYVYSKEAFDVIDQDGEDVPEITSREDVAALGGLNPYGEIPFVYINRSKHHLVPKCDVDTLQMVKILPIMLSDLNYAIMYQCFSIVYGVNVDEKNLTMAPSAFWSFKSDPTTNQSPEVGIIKPEADSDKVLEVVKAEMSMWFQSRNIKPGAMGDLSVESIASGVAKMIDEMDTSDDRKKQVPFYKHAEERFWDLLMHKLHPIWAGVEGFEKTERFSEKCKVEVSFAEQEAVGDPTVMLDDEIKKLEKRLTTRKRALKRLNPDMSEEELTALMEEIDAETALTKAAGKTDETSGSEDEVPGDGDDAGPGSDEGQGPDMGEEPNGGAEEPESKDNKPS